MLLQWEELDEIGELVTRTNTSLLIKDAYTYARKNCRRCAGRGYEVYNQVDIFTTSGRRHIHERTLACDCVLRTLSRIKNAGK